MTAHHTAPLHTDAPRAVHCSSRCLASVRSRARGQARWASPLVVLVLAAAPAIAQVASFTPLGDLPGGAVLSQANGVSADGQWVVGQSVSTDGMQAFRWSAADGLLPMGDLPGGGFHSVALAASADGSVIVGASQSSNTGAVGAEAFRWTLATGLVPLGDLPGGLFASAARACSDDGVRSAGTSVSFASTFNAVTWVEAGAPHDLGDLAGGFFQSNANGVSGDGTTIVGQGVSGDGPEAFRWTAGGGMSPLGDFAEGSFASNALDCSSDGSVVVGQGQSFAGPVAARWIGGTMESLGMLPNASPPFSSAAACSADGSVVVGHSGSAIGVDAFVWTEADGMRSLRERLEAQGVHGMDGWTAVQATGVSADGMVVVGWGYNPSGDTEGFVSQLVEPPEPEGDLLPTLVRIKVNPHKPEQSKLVLEALVDAGPLPVDLGAPLLLSAGNLLLSADAFEPNGKAFVFVGDGSRVTLKPGRLGCSQTLITVLSTGDLSSLPQDGPITFGVLGELEGQGTVMLDDGRYKLGKGPGRLDDSTLYPIKLRARLPEPGRHSLSLVASLVAPDPDPLPVSFSLQVGTFSQTIPLSEFVSKGDTLRYRGQSGGLTLVVLDWAKELVTVRGRGLDLGDYPEGDNAVTLHLGLGASDTDATARMVRKGKSLCYGH